MMVSMAIAVLPVARSPMINSRWPRPIGIIESIALMPVCSGSVTGCRTMMPGAIISMGRAATVSMAPNPSTGCPSESTTRPSIFGPVSTSRMRPVQRTSSPSLSLR